VTATASCAPGKVLLGGGAEVTTDDAGYPLRAVLVSSFPSSTTTWTAVGMVNDSNLGGGKHLTVEPYALCSL
jgi:hypothetical protein